MRNEMSPYHRQYFLARVVLSGGLALALAGCGVLGSKKGGPKTPVAGERSSILGANEIVEPDEALAAVSVTLPPPVANADWPQPGGDAAKAIGNVALGSAPVEIWSASIAGSSTRARLASAPVVSGGKLFVIGTDATVTAFDATSGARLWSRSIRATSGDEGSKDGRKVVFGGGVSVEGDRVYASTGIGDVVALNAADGNQIWKVRPGGPLRGSPTLANDHVYVMSQDNQLFALNASDGAVAWSDSGTLESTGVFGVAAPAAGQGTVIAGYSSGELTAYRYENGRVLWGDALSRTSISNSVATLTDIDADPVIDRGRVFAIGEGGRMASYELVSGPAPVGNQHWRYRNPCRRRRLGLCRNGQITPAVHRSRNRQSALGQPACRLSQSQQENRTNPLVWPRACWRQFGLGLDKRRFGDGGPRLWLSPLPTRHEETHFATARRCWRGAVSPHRRGPDCRASMIAARPASPA